MGYHQASPRKRTHRRLAENATRDDEPEWVALARRLRRQRWSYQHIADHLREIEAIAPQVGDAAAYRRVYKALNRQRVSQTDKRHRDTHKEQLAAYDKQRVNAAAPRCSVCGAKLYRVPRALPAVCRDCRLRAGARNKAAIAGLALLDWTPKQIAEQLSIPRNSVNATIAVLRKEGMPIPYKRKRKP